MIAADRAGAALSAARMRLTYGLWPALQQTAAATVSWLLATGLIHHHNPVFAPITTLIALNTDRGGRGTNAVRFVIGVVLGLLVAELMMVWFGHGFWAMGTAVLLALVAGLVIGGDRLTMAQAGVSAIISVSSGKFAGTARVEDALLGAAVALVVSQVLFPAHPLALLRRSESAILADLARALQLTAQAMSAPHTAPVVSIDSPLRSVYKELTRLGHARDSAAAAVSRTPWWWRGREAVERECVSARRLDLLGNSCLSLTRTSAFVGSEEQRLLAPEVHRLATALGTLAVAPGSGSARQRAADDTVEVVGRSGSDVGWSAIRMVVFDVLVFAGVSIDEAERVLRRETSAVRVAPVPNMRRVYPRRTTSGRTSL
ncbi:uncharacterized membrane protein YgaE (UPF0421/DUF939 family) [Nocardia transvalensis]|uniref:Uncharacterized membrane protein YgaE (UPF0421/DUF939 family) n=1 Tax=Nocardia transvalensis TaxID=37333 RepID=A0A7W9UMC9_9NOCA|nr:FUSC family protein [Nocardia transvalensis]MBB5917640.1 uncharacterized membrane protein YgaE (UPF0421/DUF939 family) [Nocardia transvalensis]